MTYIQLPMRDGSSLPRLGYFDADLDEYVRGDYHPDLDALLANGATHVVIHARNWLYIGRDGSLYGGKGEGVDPAKGVIPIREASLILDTLETDSLDIRDAKDYGWEPCVPQHNAGETP